MNRKITRLAFGAKCGCFGASGSLARRRSPIRPAGAPSAIAPRPTPHCSKNQRRVICFGSIAIKMILAVHRLFLGDRFVQVQQHARDDRPGGQLARGVAPAAASAVRRIVRRQFPRIALAIRREPLRLLCRAAAAAPPSLARSALRDNAAAERVGRGASSSVAPPSSQRLQRQRPRRFHEERLVQRGQRLQRRVRARAAHAGDLAVRRVERLQHRIRHRAKAERVERAAVAVRRRSTSFQIFGP